MGRRTRDDDGDDDDDDECSCPYSQTGQGQCADPANTSPQCLTAPAQGTGCFDATQSAFLSQLVGEAAVNNASCQSLLGLGDNGDVFWALYELDIKYCGLQPTNGQDLDPGVGRIINTCDNIGYPSLKDPGWPSTTSSSCRLCPATIKQADQASSTSSAAAVAVSMTSTASLAAASSSSSSSTTPSTISTTTSTTSHPFAAGITPPAYTHVSQTPLYQIPTQGIVAIAVCTSLGIASAIILLFCVLRRRRKQQEAAAYNDENRGETLKSRISRVANDFSLPQADSYQPLLSPSHSLKSNRQSPLTPPLRLRDRKILPSLLRPLSRSDSMLPSGSSSVYSAATPPRVPSSSSSFPSNSVCTPTTSKLEPRHEKMQVAASYGSSAYPSASRRLRSPPPVSFAFPSGLRPPAALLPKTARHHRPLQNETTTTTTQPPSSPLRPRRAPDDPLLEIPDLVSPTPPTRALPPPPSAIGLACTTSLAVMGSSGAGQQRDSWGSWGEQEDEDDDEDDDYDDDMVVESGRMFGVSFPPGPTGRCALPY